MQKVSEVTIVDVPISEMCQYQIRIGHKNSGCTKYQRSISDRHEFYYRSDCSWLSIFLWSVPETSLRYPRVYRQVAQYKFLNPGSRLVSMFSVTHLRPMSGLPMVWAKYLIAARREWYCCASCSIFWYRSPERHNELRSTPTLRHFLLCE